MPDFDATLVGLQPGQTAFGRYTLVRQLGRGGMGVVWLARDEKLEREVALKFLPEALAHDPVAINDLKRETRRALDLTHPHIVRIYDFIDDGHTAAVSMEYVDGASLTQRRLAQPAQVFSPAELQPWVEQLCEALEYAHIKAKVAHRDLKPANLMVDARGDLKVADFGISATLSETATRASQQVGSSGTPVYMSPQQMMGEKPAATDDLYALGATLYELLTGRPPFYSGNIFIQVQQKVPPSLAQRREDLGLTGLAPIPAAWEEAIAACLAKEPEQRPATAREVRARLEAKGKRREEGGGGDATIRVLEPTPDDATVSLNAPVVEKDATVRVTPIEASARKKALGPAWTIPDLGLELMPIPAGSFALGSTNGEANEQPVTQVQLTRPFWLGKYEVTQGQWQAVMGMSAQQQRNKADRSWPMCGEGVDHPIYYVSYYEALVFCEKVTLGERAAGRLPEGYEYTLPTEAQWEYACRAGTTGDYAGNLASLGWYYPNSGRTSHAVGQKQANAWGLYDMHGNVWEWCWDWYGDYLGGTVTDPTGAASGTHRATRGGCWSSSAPGCRSAYRCRGEPGGRGGSLGFRLALAPQVSQ